jgi:hypothetical protein
MNSFTNENSTTSSTEWRRPVPGEHRSPCPGLNALANGGHTPRSGEATVTQLVDAMEQRFGLARSIGAVLAKAAMKRLGKAGPDGVQVLNLADLVMHGFIEHDASLTRRDARAGDAGEFVQSLFDQLVSLSKDKKTLTLEDLAVAHQLRVAQSVKSGSTLPLKASVLGTLEATLLYLVLARDGVVAISDLVEFLQNERIPAHLSPRKIGYLSILSKAAMLAVTGNVPLFSAAKRAQKVASELVEPEAARCPVAHAPSRLAS